MNLIAELKQKNDRLLLQNALLQQNLHAIISTPHCSSFLITFAVIPFMVGVVTQFAMGANSSMSHHLRLIALSGLRFWPPL